MGDEARDVRAVYILNLDLVSVKQRLVSAQVQEGKITV